MVLASAPHFLLLIQEERRGSQTADGRILSKLAVMVVRGVMERGVNGHSPFGLVAFIAPVPGRVGVDHRYWPLVHRDLSQGAVSIEDLPQPPQAGALVLNGGASDLRPLLFLGGQVGLEPLVRHPRHVLSAEGGTRPERKGAPTEKADLVDAVAPPLSRDLAEGPLHGSRLA